MLQWQRGRLKAPAAVKKAATQGTERRGTSSSCIEGPAAIRGRNLAGDGQPIYRHLITGGGRRQREHALVEKGSAWRSRKEVFTQIKKQPGRATSGRWTS